MGSSEIGTIDWRVVARLKTLCRTLAFLVAIVGCLVLLGWTFDVASLKSVLPGYATMKSNTAIALILVAASLWLAALGSQSLMVRLLQQLSAATVAAGSLLTLGEHRFGWKLGIDHFLLHEPASIGRMSVATAFCFVLLSASLLAIPFGRGLLPAQSLALVVAFLGFVATLAYIFNVRDLYSVGIFSSMAVHTAVCLLILALGVLFLRADRGLMFVVSADSQGGKFARRSLPLIVGVPVLVGWGRLQGQVAGLYGTEFGLALFATANVSIFVSTCWFYARRLHRADSELRQAHLETLALNQTLEQRVLERTAELSRSVSELEQFAVVASHDLQEPLRSIASYAQLLATRYQGRLDREADEFIGFVVAGAIRMKRLIHDLLDYAQLGGRRRGFIPVAIESALHEALQNLNFALEHSNAVVTWDSLPTLSADKLLLVRLFQNLIGNAIKFCGPAAPPRIHISCRREGNSQVISVADNGIGIEAICKERIFDLFERLHPGDEYEGTGIGLAISKKIVEYHRGSIWVDSTPGQGSTFYFSLPDESVKANVPPAVPRAAQNEAVAASPLPSMRRAHGHPPL